MPFKLIPEEPKQERTFLEKGGRLAEQVGKEVAATGAGFLGDMGNLFNELVSKPIYEGISGKPGLSYEETSFGKMIPTSAQHRKTLESNFPSLKPENKLEKFVGELSSDTVSLFLPAKKIKTGVTAAKSFATALGANVLGELTQDLTGDEKKASYAKMGGLLGLSLLNQKGAQTFAKELQAKADSLMPKGVDVDAKSLVSSLSSLKSRVLAGRAVRDLSSSEKFVIDEADKVLRNVNRGRINLETLNAAKRSLNEELSGLFNQLPEKAARNRARSLAKGINHSIKDTMKQYGRKNPQWWETKSAADEAFGTIAQSNYISKIVKDNFKGHLATHGLLSIFGISGAATGAIVPYQAAKLLHRVYKSPALRKHYINVLKEASKENSASMSREISKLDKALQSDNKKPKYILLD